MEIIDNDNSYYFPPDNAEHSFPITPELQKLMDDEASKILLAMAVTEELGLNDFGKA